MAFFADPDRLLWDYMSSFDPIFKSWYNEFTAELILGHLLGDYGYYSIFERKHT